MRASAIGFVALTSLATACGALVGVPGSVTETVEGGPSHLEAGLGEAGDAAKDAAEAGVGPVLAVASSPNTETWCALLITRQVKCWGYNFDGLLGDGTQTDSATPVPVPGLSDVIQITIGYENVCALTMSGELFCWGYGQDGSLGDGRALTRLSPVQVSNSGAPFAFVSAGAETTCAVKTDGSAWCWGAHDRGILGSSGESDALVPTPVSGLGPHTTVAVSVGHETACAVLVDGGVKCWGGIAQTGGLGNGTTTPSVTPVSVKNLTNAVAVAVGDAFACALTKAGSVLCWGDNELGELGQGTIFASSSTPVEVGDLDGVTAISAGEGVACAISGDGLVSCWGTGQDGEQGDGPDNQASPEKPTLDVSTKPHPVKVSGPATFISTGTAPCAVTEAGVECWGTTCEIALSPIEVNGFAAGAVSISAGGFDDSSAFACASNSMVPALPDETVTECWGANADGQLGTDAGSSNAPVGTLHVTNVSAGVGGNFACGLSGGQVYCWGDGASGQLGDGQEKSTSDGVQVRDLDEVTAVGAGSTFACALSSGDVYCWGSNIYGQLGNGDSKTTQSSTPTQVKGLSDTVTALSVGYLHACALLVDGTVECWGNNVSGQLGNGTTANQHEATPVAGLTNVSSIGAGWVSSCAVTSAGSVMCWGSNAFGTLGSPSTETSTKPVPSFVSSMATQVSVGATSACAVVTGELQCWGYLVTGNDTWIRVGALTAPVTVAIGAVTSVSVGYQSTCAVAHGRAECWGYNSSGQLGNGKPGNALVPMPVAVLP